jgi:hypothetical protein
VERHSQILAACLPAWDALVKFSTAIEYDVRKFARESLRDLVDETREQREEARRLAAEAALMADQLRALGFDVPYDSENSIRRLSIELAR